MVSVCVYAYVIKQKPFLFLSLSLSLSLKEISYFIYKKMFSFFSLVVHFAFILHCA
jgi:hypothetical protein